MLCDLRGESWWVRALTSNRTWRTLDIGTTRPATHFLPATHIVHSHRMCDALHACAHTVEEAPRHVRRQSTATPPCPAPSTFAFPLRGLHSQPGLHSPSAPGRRLPSARMQWPPRSQRPVRPATTARRRPPTPKWQGARSATTSPTALPSPPASEPAGGDVIMASPWAVIRPRTFGLRFPMPDWRVR